MTGQPLSRSSNTLSPTDLAQAREQASALLDGLRHFGVTGVHRPGLHALVVRCERLVGLLEGEGDAIGQHPQRQDGLDDQLHAVRGAAVRLGCYDAADFITAQLSSREGRP